jgi:hypothetical protein
MSNSQTADITATIDNGQVVIASGHAELTKDSAGVWTFVIREETAPEVVFHLHAVDSGGCTRVVRSAKRQSSGAWGPMEDWDEDGYYVSESFVHGHDFRLEVQPCVAEGEPPLGGGFFQVREEGGGDP